MGVVAGGYYSGHLVVHLLELIWLQLGRACVNTPVHTVQRGN